MPPAGLGQLHHWVTPKGGGIHDVVLGLFGMEHAKAIVVLGGNDHVLLTGLDRQPSPSVRVELRGVEAGRQAFVLIHADQGVLHDPLADPGNAPAFPAPGGQCIQPPVNEHAKARLAPPVEPRIETGLIALPAAGR